MHMPTLLSTVLLDPPTALLFGCAVALVSMKLIEKDPAREISRTALIGGGWGVLYGLGVGWCFFQNPDWMLVYLKDAAEVSLPFAYLVFLAVCGVFGAVGALANATLLLRGQRGMAWLVTAAAILTLAATFWLQWRQYFLVGTYAEYYAAKAIPLQEAKGLQLAMNVAGAISTVSAIAIFVTRYRQSRKVILAGAARSP